MRIQGSHLKPKSATAWTTLVLTQVTHLSASIMATHSPVLRSQAKRWPQSEPEKMKSFPHHAASWFIQIERIETLKEIVTFIIVLAFLWPVSFCLIGGRLTLLLWPFCLSSSSSESESILSKLAWGVELLLLLRSSTWIHQIVDNVKG